MKMRRYSTIKLFQLLLLLSVFLFIFVALVDIKRNLDITKQRIIRYMERNKVVNENKNENVIESVKDKVDDLKYILQWTSGKNVPFVYMGVGRDGFIEKKCPYTNCFVTSDRKYFDDISKFDVIAFAGPEVLRMPTQNLPQKRSPHQKYVFANIESSHNYPVCSNKFDNYFNWTWTFRLDSISRWGYVVVRDAEMNIIGPNKNMNWIKIGDMDPVSDEFKEQLKTKDKAAAWFVSNCHTKSSRESFVKKLQKELEKYDLSVDIYGSCGKLSCPRNEDQCEEMIKNTYYFYLSFENSFSEDYVTEKLLYGLKNNAIPIVYGGANYTRFMPDGIYLNARELGVEQLAAKMNELINNPDEYAEYFRWKKYYSYYRRVESVETDDYCGFCSLLNKEEKLRETTVIENFRSWWDSPDFC